MASLFGWIQRNQNPWGNQSNKEEGPPDLEGLLKKVFGGGSKRGGQGESGRRKSGFGFSWVFIVIGIVIIWALSGIYIVSPPEQGIVLRFGKYLKTVEPGPHWYPRFIDQKYVVNVDQVNTVDLEQLMLTENENIVDVSFVVQYKIGNLKDFLLNVVDPVNSLKQSVDSAVRQVIGHSELDKILTTGRAQISDQVRQELNGLINRYQLGIVIRDVTMQPAKAPEEVKAAFDDVIKAREDKARYDNEAQGYVNQIVPVAQGHAARIEKEAKAYQQQVVFNAKGKTAEFLALASVYAKAPVVTSLRMYYSTLQNALSHSKLYVVDSGKGNLFMVPLQGAMNATLPHAVSSSSQVQVPLKPKAVATAPKASDALTGALAARDQYLRWKEAQ